MRRFIILSLLATCALSLNSCDKLITYYDIDTEANAFQNQTILEYFESGVDPNCTDFCQAIRLAKLESEIEAGNRTCIIPNNDAFAAYLSQAGYASVDLVPGALLRDLLSYLIFPGDFRSTTMEPGVNYRQTSLRGDSIFIGRSANAQSYRVVVNSVYHMESVTVKQQDYLFKNNMIGQVVDKMPLYKVELPATDSVPDGYEPEGARTDTIDVSDDTSICVYGSQKAKNFNNHNYGIRTIYRSGYYSYGMMRFPLPETDLVENLVSAQLVMNVFQLGKTYTEGTTCKLLVHEANSAVWNQWTETTATWNSIVGDLLGNKHTTLRDAAAGECSFLSAGPATDQIISVDITASLLKYYDRDSTYVDYILSDGSAKAGGRGTEMRMKDKDYYKFTSYILLTGPSESPLTIGYNNPLVVAPGYSTVFDQNTLGIEAPADPGEFDFSPQNIILQLSDLPSKGVITLYGVPLQKNQKFTYLEMSKGFVKYVRSETGADEFKLKVFDYLNGMIPEKVTITVQ